MAEHYLILKREVEVNVQSQTSLPHTKGVTYIIYDLTEVFKVASVIHSRWGASNFNQLQNAGAMHVMNLHKSIQRPVFLSVTQKTLVQLPAMGIFFPHNAPYNVL